MNKVRMAVLLVIVLGFAPAYACQVKDYECLKQKRIHESRPNYDRHYLNNETVIISGNHDATPISIDSKNGRQILRNVRFISKNARIYSSYGDASSSSIVSINNNDTDSVSLDNVRLSIYGNNEIVGRSRSSSDFNNCTAAFCLSTSGNIEGSFSVINNGSISIINR